MTQPAQDFTPEMTYEAVKSLHDDLHHIADLIVAADKQFATLLGRFDQLIEGYNQTGQNVAWLVANVQGIFQMFQDPRFMSSLMNGVLSGGIQGAEGAAAAGAAAAQGSNGN